MEQIVKRIENDKIMFANEDFFPFDYVVKNDLDITRNVEKIRNIILDAEEVFNFAGTSADIIENN